MPHDAQLDHTPVLIGDDGSEYFARTPPQPGPFVSGEPASTSNTLKKLDGILAATPDGFWSVGLDGRIKAVNDVHCATMGYRREELVGTHISQFSIRDPTHEAVGVNIRQVVARGSARFVTEHRHRDGHTVVLEVSAAYLPHECEIIGFMRDVTERQRIEEAQRKAFDATDAANKKLKTILSSMREGFWTVDMSGHVVSVNDAYCEMIGYPRAAIVGRHVRELSPGKRDVVQYLEQVERLGGPARFEREHSHRDGYTVHVAVTAVYLDEYKEIAVFLRDVTEKKWRDSIESTARLERDVQARRFEALTRASLDGFLTIDMKGMIGEVNDSLVAMLGWRAEELVGKHMTVIAVTHSVEGARRIREEADRRSQLHVETVFGRRDGGLVDVAVSLRRDPNDGQYLVFVRDISAAKRVQDERAAAAQKLVTIVETTRDGYWTTDMCGFITAVNDAYCALIGHSREEMLGRHIADFEAKSPSREAIAAHIQAVVDGGGHEVFETEHLHKDGHHVPIEVSVTHLPEYGELVVFLRDISERKRQDEAIRQAAFYDVLTGLPNRRMLIDRYHKAVAAVVRRGGHGALMFLDLDHFKALNDERGHECGDEFLREVAQRLLGSVRDGDTVARLGGDEFVVMLGELDAEPELAASQASIVAERIRRSLSQPYEVRDCVHYSACSIGVSLFSRERDELDTLLQHADSAMYQAKHAGRNAIRFFDNHMQTHMAERQDQTAELRTAVSSGQLTLHYQVQVGSDRRPVGAETLVRWIHPERGLIGPNHFIPLAEESGLILNLDEWVLRAACEQLRVWQQHEVTRNLPVSVNVSARHFSQADFADRVVAVLLETGAPPHLLKLELTETTALKNVEQTCAKMAALKHLGVRFALDDFGTGYSSLTYLKRLPFDQLKIDQSFVRGLPHQAVDAAIVESILALSQAMGMEVVAEGIETDAELHALKDRGCQVYQGYLFSRPVPTGEYEALLAQA